MKILTFSFDDCEVYDRQVCRLLRAYGMQATFYLISTQLGIRVPFHRYGKDTVVERVSAEELPATYRGMEIASQIYARHRALTDFFIRIGVSPEQAREDACKIEHDISQETFEALCRYAGEQA